MHSIKFDADGKSIFKSRLVIQGHRDPEKHRVVNEAPTILRSSVRLLIAWVSLWTTSYVPEM